ncbi:MAG TPA: TIGR01620 family protein [Geminicoccaceae bacterium]|nr:TIGR01620 family protein [Geminicoccaceae bacterium]
MSAGRPVAPFELDPRQVEPGRIAVVEPDATLPVIVPEPPPGRSPRRTWRRLLLLGGTGFLAALLGLEAYDFVTALFERSDLLGGAFSLLLALAAVGALGLGVSEIASLRRLRALGELRTAGAQLLTSQVHGRADALLDEVEDVYRDRVEMRAAIERFHGHASDALNDGERVRLFAASVLTLLDKRAYGLVKAAARDIGALTALSPLGVLDGLIVLGRTLAMLRGIARIYGVRPGTAATTALLRRTLRNVVAAGVGELVSDAAVETLGASLLSFLSTRAGQGVVNGVLAARLGLGAMQLCRPLPFAQDELPSLKQLRKELFE